MRCEKSELKILVCGDRNWTDRKMIEDVLRPFAHLNISVRIVDGYAPGADTLAHEAADSLGMHWKRYQAEWTKYGLAAGPIRNQRMLDEGKPDLVFAFHKNIAKSKGTKDMINRARKAGIPTCVFPQKRFA